MLRGSTARECVYFTLVTDFLRHEHGDRDMRNTVMKNVLSGLFSVYSIWPSKLLDVAAVRVCRRVLARRIQWPSDQQHHYDALQTNHVYLLY